MKHTHFLIIALAAILFCACDQKNAARIANEETAAATVDFRYSVSGLTVEVQDTISTQPGSGIIHLSWNFGDGILYPYRTDSVLGSTMPQYHHAKHTYSTAGTYDVTLRIQWYSTDKQVLTKTCTKSVEVK